MFAIFKAGKNNHLGNLTNKNYKNIRSLHFVGYKYKILSTEI